MSMITGFTGQYEFLSNFCRCDFMALGSVWPTAEHCYQACKAASGEQACKAASGEQAAWVANAGTPGEAKRRGRRIAIRPDWEERKKEYMLEILLAKFGTRSGTGLGSLLLATRPVILVEGNTWGDDFWGAVPYQFRWGNIPPRLWEDDNQQGWTGLNWLGRLLMTVRDVIDPSM